MVEEAASNAGAKSPASTGVPAESAKPVLPAVKRADWVRNGIDAFVLAKLESVGLVPAPPANSTMLTRRLYFDLIGLPPTPDELQDPIDKSIDRLLASPHYGERWGRHWLDVVRYADSAGYELDTFYDFAWSYRDYVIRALNDNKPMDRFLQEQIAGDELWPDSDDARIGTGFCTVGPYAYEGGIGRPKVIEYQRLTDIADTTGSAADGPHGRIVPAATITSMIRFRSTIISPCRRSSRPVSSRTRRSARRAPSRRWRRACCEIARPAPKNVYCCARRARHARRGSGRLSLIRLLSENARQVRAK